jgi:hypothetical protein
MFHRGVQSVHKQVQKMRHGELPEDMGGTKLDTPRKDGFFKLFMEELKNGHKGDGRGKKNSWREKPTTELMELHHLMHQSASRPAIRRGRQAGHQTTHTTIALPSVSLSEASWTPIVANESSPTTWRLTPMTVILIWTIPVKAIRTYWNGYTNWPYALLYLLYGPLSSSFIDPNTSSSKVVFYAVDTGHLGWQYRRLL